MQITLSIGLDRLKDLPLDMRQEIQQALDLPMQAVATQSMLPNQPVYVATPPLANQMVHNAPAYVQPQPVAPAAPEPTKQPIIQGNTKVFLPDRGHPTQQNAAIDVMTGQPQQPMSAPAAPAIPQFQNAPVNVTPVTTVGPVQMNLQPMANAVGEARAAAIRLHNDSTRGGKEALNACLMASGIPSFNDLNEGNATVLYNVILQKTGRV
jgi:hypothetical protein